MWEGLAFGWRTAILTVAFMQLLLLAAALTKPLHNRIANRVAAALLLILAAIITPWMIGFSGFYDQWPWLSFAPFQITLAVAPLFYLYVYALVSGVWPQRWLQHFLAPVAQFLFLLASFLLPMSLKNDWADMVALPYAMVTGAILITGMIGYGVACHRLLHDYRAALAAARSDDHLYAGRWLQAAFTAMALLFAIWTVYLMTDLFSPIGYRGLMGLYVAIAIFALYLGIEAWRHAALPFPHMQDLTLAADTVPATKDWKALGESWAEKVREEGWESDPELSLAIMARRLGTNSGHLSRAINEGLGVNFSTFVNDLRARRVAALIDAGRRDDLLSLALEAGFSSKASFNRAFFASVGMTPSAYRARLKS